MVSFLASDSLVEKKQTQHVFPTFYRLWRSTST